MEQGSRTSLQPTLAFLTHQVGMTFHKSPAKGGQRWRSAKSAQLPGSHLTTPRSMFDRLKGRWQSMNDSSLARRYCRYHCLCTNTIENVFVLTPSVRPPRFLTLFADKYPRQHPRSALATIATLRLTISSLERATYAMCGPS